MRSHKLLRRAAALALALAITLPAGAAGAAGSSGGLTGGVYHGLPSEEPLDTGMLEANSNRQIHPCGSEPVERA